MACGGREEQRRKERESWLEGEGFWAGFLEKKLAGEGRFGAGFLEKKLAGEGESDGREGAIRGSH